MSKIYASHEVRIIREYGELREEHARLSEQLNNPISNDMSEESRTMKLTYLVGLNKRIANLQEAIERF